MGFVTSMMVLLEKFPIPDNRSTSFAAVPFVAKIIISPKAAASAKLLTFPSTPDPIIPILIYSCFLQYNNCTRSKMVLSESLALN